MYIRVDTIEHLKSLTAEEPKEFMLMLRHRLHTRKIISYDFDSGMFHVDDMSTGYVADHTETQLAEDTNIIRAIEHGALYMEEYDEQYAGQTYVVESLRQGGRA